MLGRARWPLTSAMLNTVVGKRALVAVSVALIALPGWVSAAVSRLIDGRDDVGGVGLEAVGSIGHQIATCGTGLGASGLLVLGAAATVTLRRSGVWDFCVGAQVAPSTLRTGALWAALLLGIVIAAAIALEQTAVSMVVLPTSSFSGFGSGLVFFVVCVLHWTTLGWLLGSFVRGWAPVISIAVLVNLVSPLLTAASGSWASWVPPFAVASAQTMSWGAATRAIGLMAALVVACEGLRRWNDRRVPTLGETTTQARPTALSRSSLK